MTRKAVVSQLRQHEKYERLVAATKDLQPLTTAVAHPCDETSLRGALEAAEAGIIVPILVGPKEKIRSLAKSLDLDIEGSTSSMPRTARRRRRKRSSSFARAKPSC